MSHELKRKRNLESSRSPNLDSSSSRPYLPAIKNVSQHKSNKAEKNKETLDVTNRNKTSRGSIMLWLLTGVVLSIVVFNRIAFSSNTFDPFQNDSFPLEPVLGDNFWSSLISGHYFGLRNARPNSTVVSFMWFRNRIEYNGLNILHWCDLGDRVRNYIWNYNDLKNFGHQTINDPFLHINTSFIRFENRSLRARLQFRAPNSLDSFSIILYSVTENQHEKIEAENLENFEQMKTFTINGKNIENQSTFKVKFSIEKGETLMKSFFTKNSPMNMLKETVLSNLYSTIDKSKSKAKIYTIMNGVEKDKKESNFIAYQVVFRNEMIIDIDITFDDNPSEAVDYEKELNKKIKHFNEEFENKFALKKHPDLNDEMIKFARAILSNTIGGISYFYGNAIVRDDNNLKVDSYGPIQLLASVPSRTTFPRGFLWDEGFQQLVISAWDPELSMVIIKSWFDIMNQNGWIPREVILGDEAMARVPAPFLMQYSSNANPPSMFFAIEALIDSNTYKEEWLQYLFPRLQKWFEWFNTTQAGLVPTTFRWRGRNETTQTELNPKTLTSGLDDIPRATNPTDNEYHIDLYCWMALASRVMAKISHILKNDSAQSYDTFYESLRDNVKLSELHWNEQDKMFSDFGLHSKNVSLEKVRISETEEVMFRVFHEVPEFQFIPDKSYISLYPLMMQLLDADNEKIAYLLNSIENPEEFWTPFGLRSLSKDSFYYSKFNTEHDPPYWRGNIWINMNYLTLKALHHYSQIPGRFQERFKIIHTELRKNIVDNMFKQYQKNGFVWENYNDTTGAGRGTRPFTGWSALIVRIMGEQY